MPRQSSSRSRDSLGGSANVRPRPRPCPAIAATFSVPGRRYLRALRRIESRSIGKPARKIEKARAFRSVKFVRGETGRVDQLRQIGRRFCRRTAPCRCAAERRAARQTAAISSIGWITPVSLFARHDRNQSRVGANRRGRVRRDRSTRLGATSSQVTSKPSRFSRCSKSVEHGVMFRAIADQMFSAARAMRARPSSARLFASVPPLVKINSCGLTPKERAS